MISSSIQHHHRHSAGGFTLIELLIVIAILGLLSTLTVVVLNNARGRARDTARKASLRQVEKALELYYADNNAYPSTSGGWWGEAALYGTHCYVDGCGGSGPYILGLAPKYMAKLPADPFPHGVGGPCANNVAQAGYLYRSDGINYKFLSHCTADNGYPSDEALKDPNRPVHAWYVASPGGMVW